MSQGRTLPEDDDLLVQAHFDWERRRRRRLRLRRIASLVVVFGAWEVVGRLAPPVTFASASEMLEAFVDLAATGVLGAAFVDSLRVMAIGYVVAIVAGVSIGFVMGRLRTVNTMLDPYITVLLATPMAALIPVILILFGLSTTARIVIVFSFVLPYIIVNTTLGVRTVHPRLVEVADSFLLTEWQRVRWIVIPHAAPTVMAGVRLGFGRAIIGMLLGEMLLLVVGVGGLLVEFRQEFATASLFATVLGVLLVAVIGGAIIQEADRRIRRAWPAS